LTTNKLQTAINLQINKQFDAAAALYQEILQADPRHARALHMLGLVKFETGDYITGVGLISQAIALQPDQADAHHNLATVYRILGNFVEAEHHYHRALKLKPDYAEAYFNYSATKKFIADDPVIPALKEQLATVEQQPGVDRAYLYFAAGKIYDDLGDYGRAFEHYQKGNEAQGVTFDREQHDALIQQMIDTCNRAFLESKFGHGDPSFLPIFIVGMPRSGTTLLEQLLTRHPGIQGLGELPDITAIANTLPQQASQPASYPTVLSSLTETTLRGFGAAYIKRVLSLAPTAQRTVDKMPMNFLHLGLVALMLPYAKIIHCRRNPIDTCLSCYFQRFRSQHNYAYNLDDLAYYYQTYQRLMEHWRSVLPMPIFEVHYEELIDNQQPVMQDLIQFCGLDWHDDMLAAPDKTPQPVRTASNWQVRQPIYRTSMNRWKRYEAHIGPLIASLGEVGQ
jgi:tetratricopeptide (TPR) repeat protein